MNQYLELQFGLDSLGEHDVRAAGFDDVLDFTTPPAAFGPIDPAIIVPTSANPNVAIHAAYDYYARHTPEY